MSKKFVEPEAPKVPAYIVTFSDMVTLLLTFFVMLLSLAKVQDPELLDDGRDAFFESIDKMGLGLLTNRAIESNFSKLKIKYFINEADNTVQVRTIDAREAELRQMFQQMNESMETMRSQMETETARFGVAGIEFAPQSSELNEAGKNFLKNYALSLQQSCRSGQAKIYIVALAPDVKDAKQQWLLSAQRAYNVEAFLESILPEDFGCPVFSSGAGPKANLLQNSGTTDNSQVLIAVLHMDDT